MILPDINHPLCNEDFDVTYFKPHGTITLWPEGSVIHFDVTGPFNLEFIKSVSLLVDKLYAEVAEEGPFVEISLFRNSMLMPFESISPLRDFYRKWKVLRCSPIATAWVVGPEVEGSFIMLPLFEKIYADIERPFKHFAILEEAENWAKEILQTKQVP